MILEKICSTFFDSTKAANKVVTKLWKSFESVIKSTKKNSEQNAYFKTSIRLTIKENQNVIFNGKIDGKISEQVKGRFGFGYDPVFIPKNYDKTLAELSTKEKNAISHRSIAVTKLINFLIN